MKRRSLEILESVEKFGNEEKVILEQFIEHFQKQLAYCLCTLGKDG